MAKDIFVEFVESDVIGDVRDSVHGSNAPNTKNSKPTVEVSSWSQTVRQPKSATSSTAGGHTAERCEHADMVFTKDIDAATPKLLQACSAGTIFKTVKVYFYRAISSTNNKAGSEGGALQRKRYLLIEMNNVLVSSVTPQVGGEGLPSETFALRYSSIKWTYDEVKFDGTTGHTGVTGAWNLATNTTKHA
ncbi:MAG: Hcp family type VI secretion system effector [Aquabacterium sp.]